MKRHTAVLAAMVVTLLTAGSAAARSGVPRKSNINPDSGAKHALTAGDLKARLDNNQNIIIIDARAELNGQIIKGAIHVPMSKLEEWAKSADKKAVVVTYCTCPHDEAAEAEMNKLRELGFENAFALSGGLDAARKAGLEVVVPSE
jgi:rhodanese-related sulfurtransferase